MTTTTRRGALLATLALAISAMPAPVAFGAEPQTQTFNFTGTEQVFDVPDDVSSIHVVLVGAPGGSVNDCASGEGLCGGRGARVEANLAVTPASRLYVEVGAAGSDMSLSPPAASFNGGGAGGRALDFGAYLPGGGGASDIRTSPIGQPASVESRVIVASGGGGAGGDATGGDAGAAGAGASRGGQPGTQGAGGAGGAVGGTDGGLGIGGSGGGAAKNAGGGGGGGLYGGGGGGTAISGPDTLSGGGGGGSSYTGSATNVIVGLDNTRTPSITITFITALESGVVNAEVTIPSSAACLELSTSTIDFGTLPLGSTDERGNPDVNVTNCSGATATFFARGTDATGSGAAWTLADSGATCADTLGVDSYHLSLQEGVSGSTALWRLGTTNKVLLDVPAGFFAPFWPMIDTACPGSSGGGTTMSMQIIFVATAAE